MAFQLRRGTNAQRLGITPLQGELIYTTDTKDLYVGDGTTAGGTAIGGGGGGGAIVYGISAITATGGAQLSLTGSDSSVDNVKFAEGANITITRTDANTITIASAGGGGGAANLNDLGDVVIASAAPGEVLFFDGFSWVNGAPAVESVNSLTGIITLTTDDINEQVSPINQWFTDERATIAVSNALLTATHTGISFFYDSISGTIEATVSQDQVEDWAGLMLQAATGDITFTYDGTLNTLNAVYGGGLDALPDVSIPVTPTIGDVLKYDISGFWVSAAEKVTALSEDPAPALSAPLDLSTQSITGIGSILIDGAIESEQLTIGRSSNNYNSTLSITNGSVLGGGFNVLEVFSAVAAQAGGRSNYTRARGTVASPATVNLGDVLHAYSFSGVGTNTAVDPIPSTIVVVTADAGGSIGTNFAPGRFNVKNRNNAGSLIDVLILDKDGKITVANNTLTAGAGSGQVDVPGGVVSYLQITVGSTTYALPLYGLNP